MAPTEATEPDFEPRPNETPVAPEAVAESIASADEADPLPPPRPTTPPVRMGFLKVLGVLLVLSGLVYGMPVFVGRIGYAWEAGRARAAIEALEKLDERDVQNRSSALFRMATRAVSPAVVSIRTSVNSKANGSGDGLGSGVIVDKTNGYIVTNNHVIRDAAKIVVRIGRAPEVEATLVGADERTDLAVLKIEGPLAVEAAWGDSDKLDVGDWVLAIGSPYGLDHTVTAGIVSASGRNNLLPGDIYEDFIQTDAAINPGNSGGPLIDLMGRIVGINTAIITPKDGGYQAQGIGLAISSSLARRVVEQLIKNKRVVRGYLGILPDSPRPGVDGVPVAFVRENSPAAKAGIKQGDLIVALDGRPVDSFSALRNRTFTIPVGDEVPIELMRGADRKTLIAKIAEMPNFAPIAYPKLGMELREAPGIGGGGLLVAGVRPGGPAAMSGLQPGLLITAVGPVDVRSLADFDQAVMKFDLIRGIPVSVQAPDGRKAVLQISGIPFPR